MNKKELEAFAKEVAKGIKTPQDHNDFSRMLKKIIVEATLNAEIQEHLGYEKHIKSVVKNSRNGMTTKRVKPKVVSLTSTHHVTMVARLSLS
jgi:transposase-like protein